MRDPAPLWYERIFLHFHTSFVRVIFASLLDWFTFIVIGDGAYHWEIACACLMSVSIWGVI